MEERERDGERKGGEGEREGKGGRYLATPLCRICCDFVAVFICAQHYTDTEIPSVCPSFD